MTTHINDLIIATNLQVDGYFGPGTIHIGTSESDHGTLSYDTVANALVVNEDGIDVDLRVEGNTEPNLLLVNAGTDSVGIGGAATADRLTVRAASGSVSALNVLSTTSSTTTPTATFRNDGTQGVDRGVQIQFVHLPGAALTSGSMIGRLKFVGETDTGFKASGFLEMLASSLWTDASSETDFCVQVTPSGSTIAVERFRVTGSGSVGIGTSTPTSILHSNGSIAAGVTATSSSIPLDDSHHTVFVTTAASTITITLPEASTGPGRRYEIKKVDSGAGSVSVARAGSDTIDGATTQSLTAQYESITLVSDGGTSWFIV